MDFGTSKISTFLGPVVDPWTPYLSPLFQKTYKKVMDTFQKNIIFSYLDFLEPRKFLKSEPSGPPPHTNNNFSVSYLGNFPPERLVSPIVFDRNFQNTLWNMLESLLFCYSVVSALTSSRWFSCLLRSHGGSTAPLRRLRLWGFKFTARLFWMLTSFWSH